MQYSLSQRRGRAYRLFNRQRGSCRTNLDVGDAHAGISSFESRASCVDGGVLVNPLRRFKAIVWTVRDRRRRARIRARLDEVGQREPEFADLMKMRKDWLFTHLPRESAEFIYDLHSKDKQKVMAERVGLSVAEEYLSGLSLDEALAHLASGTYDSVVLKPNHGRSGAGVFCLVREGSAFRELKSGKVHDVRQLRRLAEDSYGRMKRSDDWILEELLVSPTDPNETADDVKFYCFGDRAEMVLQKGVLTDERGRRRVWLRFYDRDGTPVDPGLRPKDISDRLTLPASFEELRTLAERASGHIPTPFMRVDMYDTHRGGVLGEFTPGSGGMYSLNLEWKERFTRRWHETASELERALASGERQPLMPGTAGVNESPKEPRDVVSSSW